MTPRLTSPWIALGSLLATSVGAFASVTLNYQFISPELTPGTRCLLVASTLDSDFEQPGDLAGVPLTQGATFGGDNLILGVFTAEVLPGSTTGVSGVLNLTYEGPLGEGDVLRLYWLPGLDPAAGVLPLGGGFVDYRSDLAGDGGTIGYVLPPDGSTDSIYSIATANGGTAVFPGSVPATIATYPHDLDSDGDQMSDLLEFVMGLDPYVSSTADQPTVGYLDGGAKLGYDFALRDDLALHDIAVQVESSFTLLDGSWFPVAMQPSPVAGRWEVIVPTPTGANARQFFRFELVTP